MIWEKSIIMQRIGFVLRKALKYQVNQTLKWWKDEGIKSNMTEYITDYPTS